MTIINIYEDPDYGWTVMDHSGLITPCQDFDGVIEQIKEIGKRFEPAPDVNCPKCEEIKEIDPDHCGRCVRQ